MTGDPTATRRPEATATEGGCSGPHAVAGRPGFGENWRVSIAELPIQIDRERVAEFCRARGIRRLSLFGSVLREAVPIYEHARSEGKPAPWNWT